MRLNLTAVEVCQTMCTCTNVCTGIYVCVYDMYVCLHVCFYACMCVCVLACMYLCMYVDLCKAHFKNLICVQLSLSECYTWAVHVFACTRI